MGIQISKELNLDILSIRADEDFKKANEIAYLMVKDDNNKEQEIQQIIKQCYRQAKEIIASNKSLLDKIFRRLLDEENIIIAQIENL